MAGSTGSGQHGYAPIGRRADRAGSRSTVGALLHAGRVQMLVFVDYFVESMYFWRVRYRRFSGWGNPGVTKSLSNSRLHPRTGVR